MIYQELEALADPMKKEIGVVRKKIDVVNKELKPLGQTCQKKVNIYSDYQPLSKLHILYLVCRYQDTNISPQYLN